MYSQVSQRGVTSNRGMHVSSQSKGVMCMLSATSQIVLHFHIRSTSAWNHPARYTFGETLTKDYACALVTTVAAINSGDFKAIEGIQELKGVRSSRSSINW